MTFVADLGEMGAAGGGGGGGNNQISVSLNMDQTCKRDWRCSIFVSPEQFRSLHVHFVFSYCVQKSRLGMIAQAIQTIASILPRVTSPFAVSIDLSRRR